MALIKCPECGKEISDKAPACIHCGFPIGAANSAIKSEPAVKTKPIVAEKPNVAINDSAAKQNEAQPTENVFYCGECGKFFYADSSQASVPCGHCGSAATMNCQTGKEQYMSLPDDRKAQYKANIREKYPTKEAVISQRTDLIRRKTNTFVDVQRPEKPSVFNVPFFLGTFLACIILWLFSVAKKNDTLDEGVGLMWLLIGLTAMFFIGAYMTYKEKKAAYERASEDFEKYKTEETNKVLAERARVAAVRQELADKKAEVDQKRSDARAKGLAACPRCGSTSIVTMHRGYSAFWGFIGSATPVNVCQSCGEKFKPGT